MDKDCLIIQARAKTLEDLFFLQQDRILMEQLHRMQKMKETKASLAKVSGITNEDVLQKLVELHIRPDVVATLALAPLVAMAWADGEIEEQEKAAVLRAGRECFAKNSPDVKILKQWLQHKPGPRLLEAWKHYVRGLCEQMTASQKAAFRDEIVGHARQVAQTTGGFLGLGDKISRAEQKLLAQFSAAFE